MARPTSLTPAASRAIVEALKAGNYIDTACRIAGITKQTFYGWLKRGRANEKPYDSFLDSCERAIANCESSMLAQIRAAGKWNWQAIAWIMERRFRQRWAKPSENGPMSSGTGQALPAPNVVIEPKPD